MPKPWTLGLLAFLTVALASGAPPPLSAQQSAAPVPVPDETLTAYARAFTAIEPFRHEMQEELAASTNKSPEVQARLREQMAEEVTAILESHGLTREQYMHVTFVVSTDPAHRERLDAILTRLAEDEGR